MNQPWSEVLTDPKLRQKELTGRQREPLPPLVKPRYKPAREERKRESWLSENRNSLMAVGAQDPFTYRQKGKTKATTTAVGFSSSYRVNTTDLPAKGQEGRAKDLPQLRDRRRDVDVLLSGGWGVGLNAGPKTCAHGDATPERIHDHRRKACLCWHGKGSKLSFWRLDHFPVGIDVTQITFLCVSDHKVSFVPAHLASCVNLRTLLLTGNKLVDLGQGVLEQLHLLKKLWVNHNDLYSIHEVVSHLRKSRLLEDLNILQNPCMGNHSATERIMESLPLLKYLNEIELTGNTKHQLQGRYPDVHRDEVWDGVEAGPISLPGSPTVPDRESTPPLLFPAREPSRPRQGRRHVGGRSCPEKGGTRGSPTALPLIPFAEEALRGGGTEQERWKLYLWRRHRHDVAREEDALASGPPCLQQGALLPDGDVAWEDWKNGAARAGRRSDALVALELEAARRLEHAAESGANARAHGEQAHLPGEPFRTRVDGDVLYHWSHALRPAVSPEESSLWGGLFPDADVAWVSWGEMASAGTMPSTDDLEAAFLGWDDSDDYDQGDGDGDGDGDGGDPEDMQTGDLSMLF